MNSVPHSVYRPHERPEVELLVAGDWYYGEGRMRSQSEDGAWSANVMWSRAAGENRLGTFPAESVRPLASVRPGAVARAGLSASASVRAALAAESVGWPPGRP